MLGIICLSDDAVNFFMSAGTPQPPPALSVPVCDSDVILGTPYHWHAISVFELVLYRVEDQRSIFMQGDYLILI